MKQAVAYLRVSTTQQSIEGVSISAQRDRIAAWCTATDHQLVGVYIDEGLSGKSMDSRPELQRAIEAATNNPGSCLVVLKLDRLARNTRDTLTIVDTLTSAGCSLVSVSESFDSGTAAGEMMLTMLAGFATMERRMIAERTQQALDFKRAQGERIGSIPYGMKLADDGIHLLPDKAEIAVIREARRLRRAGLSLRKIAQELGSRGIVSRAGKRFDPKQIQRMLAA